MKVFLRFLQFLFAISMLVCQGAHLRTSLEKSLQFRVRKGPCARNDKGKHVINIDKKPASKLSFLFALNVAHVRQNGRAGFMLIFYP